MVSGASPNPWPRRSAAWFTVAVLTFAYAMSFVDRQALTQLVPAIKADLGLADTEISLLQRLAIIVCLAAGLLGGGPAPIVGGLVVRFAEGLSSTALPLIGSLPGWKVVFILAELLGLLVPLLTLFIRESARMGRGANDSTGWIDLGRSLVRFRALLARNVGGFAFLSTLAYGLLSGAPTQLIRTQGWTTERTGLPYGAVLLFSGAAGAVLGGQLARRLRRAGNVDAALRVAALGAIFVAVFARISGSRSACSLWLPSPYNREALQS